MLLVLDIKKEELQEFMQYIDISYSGGNVPEEIMPIAVAVNKSLKNRKKKKNG